jgi:hypothetical protein
MPNLSDFASYMAEYSKEVTDKAQEAYKAAAMKGSATMKAFIRAGSPTNDVRGWHRGKNLANKYAEGARRGSKVEFRGYAPSAAPDTMLNSVERGSIEQSPNGFSVAFGWLKKQEPYFGQQDLGNYRPNGVGMGLLNEGQNSGKKMYAALEAEAELLKKMKSAKFKVKGSFF